MSGLGSQATATRARRVALVTDDAAVVAEALAALREIDEPASALVFAAAEGTSAVNVGDRPLPDLLVIEAPDGAASAEIVRQIRAADPGRLVPIVAICSATDPALPELVQTGCNGVLPREAGVRAVIAAAATYWLAHNLVLRQNG